MACSLAPPIPVLHPLGRNRFSYLSRLYVSMPKLGYCSLNKVRFRRLCSVNSNNAGDGLADAERFSLKAEESSGNGDSGKAGTVGSNETLTKLRRYGTAGLLSYGLLNTVYYLTTFIIVWFYVAPAPGKIGFVAAAQRFLKIMAMVWAGSQVNKLIRAGGDLALALAPFVDRGLSWFTVKFRFKSQGKAFTAIVGFCFGPALVLFFAVTLLSA